MKHTNCNKTNFLWIFSLILLLPILSNCKLNISNIFAGLALNIERPFRIGDKVKIGDLNEGEVLDITWRTIKIRTRDNVLVSIPNSAAAENPIHNLSYPTEQSGTQKGKL